MVPSIQNSGVDRRCLDVLQRIAEAGGTITPNGSPQAIRGYEYAALGDDVDDDLMALAKGGYLDARFFDRISLCPKCASHHLNVREICPGCSCAHLESEGLLHHFRCGYVGIPREFTLNEDGSYLCPKCKRRMYHLGTEFDRLGRAFVCHSCARISDNPPVEAVCLNCGQHTKTDDLVCTNVFSYVLTSRGFAAIQRKSLLGEGVAVPVSVVGAPAYRPEVTQEFLEHEMKLLKHFNRTFSVLLAECAPASLNQTGEDLAAHWLGLLRGFLREIDLFGQLADALYVAILPQTERDGAEALCRSIAKKLGSQSPLTLSTFEISEPVHLETLLSQREGAKGRQ